MLCRVYITMRIAWMAMVVAVAVTAAEPNPAELRVTSQNGSLSYEIVNALPVSIVAFQVLTRFTSGGFENLGCTVTAQVKQPSDLTIRNACKLPVDAKTGKPVSFVSRIVSVDFAKGLKWTPPEPPAIP